MSPGNIKGVDLHEGEWGTVGSVIVWNYFHDGKPKVAKEVIEAIDEEKKSVCFKVIGGDILEAYTKFLITVHVDTHGEENVVTWTFHYEKVNEKIEDPESLMEFCLNSDNGSFVEVANEDQICYPHTLWGLRSKATPHLRPSFSNNHKL
ncbi:hypothetical protein E3N88_40538 [Mikania micrantha]|uniref:Bet v I/Major latex protein domain-containing protein n=1 Tax=Mikania micrantha TaxID=192012 RepID=A0A5N6LNS9_9ASTR|nr:hypothetical protein E3N88_40538 [Mikania micrantha]